MDEQEFRRHADAALDQLYRKVAVIAEQHDFETDFNSGALAIEFDEPPGKFVISPNTPVRQIWVSAHSRSYKLDWDAGRGTFIYPENGSTLMELIADAIGKQIGAQIRL